MEVQIPANSSFYFYPCQSQSLHFSVKAEWGAVICIATRPYVDKTNPGILIAGYWNKDTAMVAHNYLHQPIYEHIRLDKNKFLDFWFKWDGGRLRFGVGTEENPLINKSLEEAVGHEKAMVLRNRRFFGIAMSEGLPGTFRIIDDGLHGLNPPWKEPDASGIPDGALIVGFEDGSPLYVGRKCIGHGLLVEKVHPELMDPIVSGERFEILWGIKNPLWETVDKNSTVPSRALVAGFTEEGEPVYIGRARHKMDITVGQVEGAGGFRVMDGNDKVSLTPYQVLLVPEKQ